MNKIARYNTKSGSILKDIKVPTKFKASSPAKISLKPNCAFSMLPGPKYSCPGATKKCKDCYAMKNRFLFKNVIGALAKNWLLYQQFYKHKDLAGLTKALAEVVPKDAKVFRLGESGDMPSKFYIDAWAAVIKSRPDVMFWTYTRSFRFDYTNILSLPNFNLWASADRRNNQRATEFVERYKAYGVKKAFGPWRTDWVLPNDSFVCPTLSHKIPVAGACEKCKLCVVRDRVNKSVVFIKH